MKFCSYVSLFIGMSLIMIPGTGLTQPLEDYETYEGNDLGRKGEHVVIILEKHDQGTYTVVGRFSPMPGVLESCIITGTYYPQTKLMKGTADCSGYERLVDGKMSDDNSSLLTTITALMPYRDLRFYGNLQRLSPTAEETAAQNAEATEGPLTVGGISPSPPDVHEEWNGLWKGKAKTVQTTDGIAPVTREQEFEFQVMNDGTYIHIIGDRELKYKLTYSNPNAALQVVEKEEPAVLGTAASKEKVVVFLRAGRFYMQRLFKATATYQDSTTNAVTDTITIADRVK